MTENAEKKEEITRNQPEAEPVEEVATSAVPVPEDEAAQNTPPVKLAPEDLVQIESVSLASEEAGHRVTLKETKESQGELDMFVGGSEFASIAKELGLMTPPRPLTHDVYNHLLEGLEVGYIKLEIYGLEENAYLSRLYYSKNGQDEEMEIRPSDGIAIALRNEAPIFLNKRLLKNTLSPKDQDTLAQLVKKVEF